MPKINLLASKRTVNAGRRRFLKTLARGTVGFWMAQHLGGIARAQERKVGGLRAKKGQPLKILKNQKAARDLSGKRVIAPRRIYSGDFITLDGEQAGVIVTLKKGKYKAEIVEHGKSLSHINEIVKRKNPLIAFNGGYYEPDKTPSAALVVNGKIMRGINPQKFGGLIYIDRHGELHIAERQNFPALESVRFAVQTFIVDAQGIRGPKGNYTLIGKKADGDIAVIAIKNSTPDQAAELMRSEWNCTAIALLDGGPMSRIVEKTNEGYISSDLFEGETQGESQNFFVIY